MDSKITQIPGETKCYCKHKSSGVEYNQIMCDKQERFQEIGSCNIDELCTGPATANDANVGISKLCDKGRNCIKCFKLC